MSVTTALLKVNAKTRAIVCFGHPTATTGMRAGEYYQVVIDPALTSPDGTFIRFDQRNADAENEIHGWQRIDALTVCEVLDVLGDETDECVTVRAIVKE